MEKYFYISFKIETVINYYSINENGESENW